MNSKIALKGGGKTMIHSNNYTKQLRLKIHVMLIMAHLVYPEGDFLLKTLYWEQINLIIINLNKQQIKKNMI